MTLREAVLADAFFEGDHFVNGFCCTNLLQNRTSHGKNQQIF